MNKILSFEDLLVWQKAKEQVVSIYKIFHSCRDYSFRDQIQRAIISVMNNIAEGFACLPSGRKENLIMSLSIF